MAALAFASLLARPVFAQVPVTVAWDPNGDGMTTGYVVTVGLASNAAIANIDVGAATSAVLPLPPGRVYFVAVVAYNAMRLNGVPSPEVVVDLVNPPGAPMGVGAQVSGATATLHWTPPSAGGAPTRYLLSVGTAPGASNLVTDLPVGNVLGISGNVPPGTYYARVHAGNMVGVGPSSAEVVFHVGGRSAPPTSLTVSGSGTVRFAWQTPSTGAPSAYVLEAGTGPGLANIGSFNVGAATSYAVAVPPGTFYVRVRASSGAGLSDPSNEVVVQGADTPGTPRSLSWSQNGGMATFTWSAPGAGSAPSHYVMEVGSRSGASDLLSVSVGPGTSFSVPVPTGKFYVRVRGANARGMSLPSNEIVVQR